MLKLLDFLCDSSFHFCSSPLEVVDCDSVANTMHPVSSFIQSKRSLFSKFSPFYPHKTDAHKVCFQKPGEWVIKISENVKKT